MIKFWMGDTWEDGTPVEYVWLHGEITNIYSPYEFELVEKGRHYHCDYTKVIEPKLLELNIGEKYSVQGHLASKGELWVTGKPVPESVIEERRKERMRVEEEVKEEIKEKAPEEYQLKMEVIE